MDINNIYGEISNGSEIVITTGTTNSINGIGCYLDDRKFQILPLSKILNSSDNIGKFIFSYEYPLNKKLTRAKYFSLYNKKLDKYLGIEIIRDIKTQEIKALVCLSKDKTVFNICYSVVDRNPSFRLMSGSLISLETKFGEKDYTIVWDKNGGYHEHLVIFLPLTWYQKEDNVCVVKKGKRELLEALNSSDFKGFSQEDICKKQNFIYNCNPDEKCGDCIGKCSEVEQICIANHRYGSVADKQYNNHLEPKFICNYPSNTSSVKATDTLMSNNSAFWLGAISTVILLLVLAVGIIITNLQ